jgi:archaellum biogenesis protein FlaJ (TadC family)
MALTVYQTVPDPAEETKKGPVRYAQAVITIPLGVAAQLPKIITGHLFRMADADAMFAAALTPMIEELGKVVAHYQAKLQEKEG